MKRVFLIGDSIRKGYDKYVKMSLDGVAEVASPQENCRFTSYIIRNLFEWKKQSGWDDADLVHWNAGLWDTLVMLDGLHLVDIETYGKNVERICNLIKMLFPSAKMIFATSTPVQEELFKEHKRYNRDVEAYNAIAIDIVQKHGGKINDLYTTMSACPVSYHSDLTHYYTKDGTRVITDQVLAHIEAALGIHGTPLDYDALFAPKDDIVGF